MVTPTGWPAVSTPVLRSLAGRPGAAKLALAELTGNTSTDTGDTFMQRCSELVFQRWMLCCAAVKGAQSMMWLRTGLSELTAGVEDESGLGAEPDDEWSIDDSELDTADRDRKLLEVSAVLAMQ